MKRRRLVAAGGAAVLAAAGGCSLSRDYPAEITLFGVETPAGVASASRREQTLRIGNVRVAPSYAGSDLVYRLDDVRYASDFYNRLSAPPAGMLAVHTADWLNRNGPFRFVAQPGATSPTTHVLEVMFSDLYGDFRSTQAPVAVMAAQFQLIDVTASPSRLVLERSYEQRVPLAAPRADELVRGYGVALGRMLADLNGELARLPF